MHRKITTEFGGYNVIGFKLSCNGETETFYRSINIGRGSDNDFVVKDGLVSRKHCKIILKNNEVYIKDIGSKNGTYINSNRLTTNEEESLMDGDSFYLADERFTFTINFALS